MPKFLGEITQSGGDFALLDSSNIRGGFMQVDTIQERDNIIPDKLKKGMHCYVAEEERIFEWKGDQWAEFKVSGNELSDVQFFTISQKVSDKTILYGENEVATHWGIKFEGDILFKDGDIIGWNISSDKEGNITGRFTEIDFIKDNIAYISVYIGNQLPDKYQTVYLIGSTSDIVRRCVLAIHPHQGTVVMSQFLNKSLDNLNTDYTFRVGQHSSGSWKIYGENVFFKGTFIDEQGRNLSDVATISQETVSTGLSGLRREFGYENLLNNPYFIGGMDCWMTRNTATYFTAGRKFIMTNRTLLTTKKDGAYVIMKDGQAALRLINGFIQQRNYNLKKINDFDNVEPPYYVTLIFNYQAITDGDLGVAIMYDNKPQYKTVQHLTADGQTHTWKSTFLWDGEGDFTIEYSGTVEIQTLVLKMNEAKNLELKYQKLFDYSDVLIEMAEKYEQSKQ